MSAQTPTILFVEARGERGGLCAALRAEGFVLREVSTGAEALRLAREHVSLIVLDQHLPDLSGAEVWRRLKGDPATAGTPVLCLSGHCPEGPCAADAYLVHPVEPPELIAQVRTMLRLRQVEQDLRDSVTWLRDILDHAPVVVQVKDVHGRYLLVNLPWERRFGLPREQVLGRSVAEVFPDQAETLAENDRRVLAAGIPLEFEEVTPQADGLHTFLSVKFPLFGPSGTPLAVCGISTDISERKKWEKALGDSEALYHSLVESLPVSIIRKDLAGRFTFVNRPFCQGLGLRPEDILGKTDRDFYPAPLAEKYAQDDHRVAETGEVFEDVEEHQAHEGVVTFVEVVKSPLRDSHGQVIGVQGVFWDITARKRAEEELTRTAAEFRIARRIQQRLFPTEAPRVPGMEVGGASFGFDLGGASFPAEAIGGDYFDYLALPDGSLGVAIGDVSGHGVGPALLMAEARALLRAFAQTETDVSRILALANRTLTPDVEGDRFITLLLAKLDPRERTLSYASAGQMTGYVFASDGTLKRALESTGIPLGIFPETPFPCGEPVPLEEGDLILFLTDGVVEARAPDGAAFGSQRTIDLVRLYRHAGARQIVDNLYYAVRAFAQYRPQFDDITAMVVKVASHP
jgi:sigma-B regulation protein RsbU (phosphoserine phosphatase)